MGSNPASARIYFLFFHGLVGICGCWAYFFSDPQRVLYMCSFQSPRSVVFLLRYTFHYSHSTDRFSFKMLLWQYNTRYLKNWYKMISPIMWRLFWTKRFWNSESSILGHFGRFFEFWNSVGWVYRNIKITFLICRLESNAYVGISKIG